MDPKDLPIESTTPISEITPDLMEIKKSKKPGPRPTPCIWCGSTTCSHCQCTGYAKCDHAPGTQCTRQRYKRRLVCNPCEKSKLKNSMAQLSEADYTNTTTIKKNISDAKVNRSTSVDSALNKTIHKNSYSFKALLDTVMTAVKEQERAEIKQKDSEIDLKIKPIEEDDEDVGMPLDEPMGTQPSSNPNINTNTNTIIKTTNTHNILKNTHTRVSPKVHARSSIPYSRSFNTLHSLTKNSKISTPPPPSTTPTINTTTNTTPYSIPLSTLGGTPTTLSNTTTTTTTTTYLPQQYPPTQNPYQDYSSPVPQTLPSSYTLYTTPPVYSPQPVYSNPYYSPAIPMATTPTNSSPAPYILTVPSTTQGTSPTPSGESNPQPPPPPPPPPSTSPYPYTQISSFPYQTVPYNYYIQYPQNGVPNPSLQK